jgi:hypothetical protein
MQYVPSALTIINCAFCSQSVFTDFVWFSKQTGIISSNSNKQLIFVTENALHFLLCKKCIFKYYYDEFRLQKVYDLFFNEANNIIKNWTSSGFDVRSFRMCSNSNFMSQGLKIPKRDQTSEVTSCFLLSIRNNFGILSYKDLTTLVT